MKNLVHCAVAGAIAAALMVLVRLLLSQQAVLVEHYHCPPFALAGAEGLSYLGRVAVFGAGYGVAYGLLLSAILPGGWLVGSVAMAVVPTLVDALVLPLRQGQAAIRDPWTLLWLFTHWLIYAFCLVFILGTKGGKGGKGGRRGDDD